MRTLTVAALQTAPLAHDLEGTWERFATAVENVRELFPQAQLVMAPELHLSAVGHGLEERAGWTEEAAFDIPGPLTDRLGALARRTGLWLVPGTVYERGPDPDVIHNTALVVSPQGPWQVIGAAKSQPHGMYT